MSALQWGGINAYPLSGSPPPRQYIDPYLRFFPQPFSLLGRSIVIEAWNGQRIACGNIISALDGTADSFGTATNAQSSYQNDYASIDIATPSRSMNIANGAWGKVVQTSRISAASMTVPASLPPISAGNNIVLTTDSNGQAEAVAASTTYSPGASLPTQQLLGQTSSSVEPSATIARGVVAGASNSAAPSAGNTGAACSRAGIAGSAAGGVLVTALLAVTLA